MDKNDAQGRSARRPFDPLYWLGGNRGTAIVFLMVAAWFVAAMFYVLLTNIWNVLPWPLVKAVMTVVAGLFLPLS